MIRILVVMVDDVIEQAGQKLGGAHVVADVVESTVAGIGSGGVIPRLVVVRRLEGREDVLEGGTRGGGGGGHRA